MAGQGRPLVMEWPFLLAAAAQGPAVLAHPDQLQPRAGWALAPRPEEALGHGGPGWLPQGHSLLWPLWLELGGEAPVGMPALFR